MSIRTHAERTAAWICAAYAAATFAWYGVWRHFYAERSADEAIFENVLWNGVHGHGLRTWIEGGVPHLAVHFSPVLYVLLPVYAWFGSMYVVHFTASVLTALAGFFFFRHVARTLDTRSALPAMLAFLLCPTIVLQTFMEFHEQALAILPLTLLLISWADGSRTRVLWSALALLTVREDNVLLVTALGALSLVDRRQRVTGWMLLALGVAWIGAWRVVVAQLLPAGHAPNVFGGTYSYWGDSPGQVLKSVLSRPVDVIRHVVAPIPLGYLALLFAPVLVVLPFASRLALLLLPQLFMVLLANYDSRMFQIRMHYSVVPAVVSMFAAVATLGRAPSEAPGFGARVRRWAPIAMMAVVVLLTPGWAIRAVQRLNPYTREIREVLAVLPDSASVTAPGYLLNHLAGRPRLALDWDGDIGTTDYVVLEDSSRFFFNGTTVDIFHTPRLDSLLVAKGYAKVPAHHGWHVYRRLGAL